MPPAKPAKPTVIADTVDVEALAKTLIVEHEAASVRRTVTGDLTDIPKLPHVFALPEPYRDRGEIGRGGMGAVRSAFDNDLQRLVAIKAMLPELSKKQVLAQRFLDEARITALIDHPNIAPVYRLEHGSDGSLLLVMKLIEGRTFSNYLRSLPKTPWPAQVLDAVLSILVKICDAVAFAHSRGVIHLDLKPENVMLGPFGQVYVVDWGIARYRPPDDQHATLKTLSEKGVSTGTPSFMSPEQALRIDAHISELTDVYLLGGMLYEILTGHAPHGGKTVVEILTSAIRGIVTPPAQRTPKRAIPSALAIIAMKALSARPQDRYQSVLDFQQDVLAFQRGEERAPRRVYPAGTLVIREGELGDEAFVIVSGRCKVTAVSEGKAVFLRELGPGDLFGETAVFSDEPRTATVEAIDELVVRVVARETLSQSLGLNTWAGEFIKTLADRFREADRRTRPQ